MRYYEQDKPHIDRFREEYEFLSNFYPAKLEYEGITYYNSEAAYQAQKCRNIEDRILFAEMYSNEAKKFGRTIEIREDWDEVKVEIMRAIVNKKFSQNSILAKRLVETGEKLLIEGNYWHDVFWGVDLKTGEGENYLGKILMELREQYKKEGLPKEEKTYCIKMYGPINDITITDEDITQLEIECIVNAANKTLLGGSGVDGAIHREAGPELLSECKILQGCNTGEAKITGGYQLKANYVIHTVGPVYGKDDNFLLECCYRNCLDLAKEKEIHSIAFPAISTGKYCFPKEKAMEIAIRTVTEWKNRNNDYKISVVFSCIDKRIYQYACEWLEKVQENK